MPIYSYKCASCGHSQDVLQKMSDAPLVDCPVCGAASLRKQLTAAGFQLKGSGWYATDFKGAAAGPGKVAEGETAEAKDAAAAKAETPAGTTPAAGTAALTAAAGSSTPAATGCAGGCTCH